MATLPSQPRDFLFILGEGFSLFCLAAALDALRAANMVCERDVYRWSMVSHDGNPIQSSSGLALNADHSVDEIQKADITFVIASMTNDFTGARRVINVLRNLGRRGLALGALSTGTHILAAAGQLEGHRCTIHWQHRAAFREAFPEIDCTSSVYEIDRDRYTSAGGATGFDLMIEIIRQDCGADIANRVANNFNIEHIRGPGDRQRAGHEPDLAAKSDKLQHVAKLMADNLEEPLSAGELAQSVGLSIRQVERLFLKHLKSTPSRYYMTMRLERARQLLRQTNQSILDVALSTGFTSHSYFAQSYRMQFGRPPSDERRYN